MYYPNLFKAGGSNATYYPDSIRIPVPMPNLRYNNVLSPDRSVNWSERGMKPNSRLSVTSQR